MCGCRTTAGFSTAPWLFAADGVTVVEGPNEVGKTCIPEALDLLIAMPDNSKARKVRDVEPVHRDAGPEVEVEMSSGQYRFRYSKRWLRRPETRLAILAPTPRNLTGRDAHDRVEALLEETLDAELWRAMRVEQGTELVLPQLAVPSLGRALDRAAAGELVRESRGRPPGADRHRARPLLDPHGTPAEGSTLLGARRRSCTGGSRQACGRSGGHRQGRRRSGSTGR